MFHIVDNLLLLFIFDNHFSIHETNKERKKEMNKDQNGAPTMTEIKGLEQYRESVHRVRYNTSSTNSGFVE